MLKLSWFILSSGCVDTIEPNSFSVKNFEESQVFPSTSIVNWSAVTGNQLNLSKIWFTFAIYVDGRSQIRRISQKELNKCFINAITNKQPPSKGKKTPELFSISQYKVGPPGFKFESSNYDLIHFSYKRYLENNIRQSFDFSGCPISLRFVKGKKY